MTLLAKALYYWRGFASGSVNRRIFYAMMVIAIATFAVKAAAVGKDMVVARVFGLDDVLDAFLIALVIPAFAVTVLSDSFNGSFMPTYIRVREHEGEQAAKCLFGHMILLNLAILLAFSVLLAAVADPLLALVGSEFTDEKRALARHLFLLLLPLLVLEGQLSLWGAVLNAGEKFALVALAPILTPLAIIALLVSSGAFESDVRVLVWGTLIGVVAELVVVGVALAKRGLMPIPQWRPKTNSAGEVLRQYVPLVMSGMIMSSSTVIDQTMASWLGSGSVAALNYGNKIPAFFAGIGVTALGTAVLPHFSRLVAHGDHAAIRHTLRTYTKWVLLVSIPFTVLAIASSEWIVRILFERGAFKAEDTLLVARIQQMYLLQVPFFVLGILGVRILLAMSRNHLLTIMSVVNLAVNVIGNLIFMKWFGVSGIALSTSVVYIVSMAMILWLVSRNLSRLKEAAPA